jgi:bifunctional non-homologous end joining protein LigD
VGEGLASSLLRWRPTTPFPNRCSLAQVGSRPAATNSYEVKWDGFRAIVSTEGEAGSQPARLGHDAARPVLADLPVRGIFDGELVALDEDGKPDFPLICECLLQRHSWIPLTYMVFDVLSVEGEPMTMHPYAHRRIVLEDLQLAGPNWRTPQVFDDGEALWEAICEHELEGVVAKRRRSRYIPGDRGWIKIKNRDYWRYEIEREGAFNSRRERQFV